MSHQRHKSRPSSAPFGRRLAIEPLEDRRLLAVVNTLIDEADGSITDGDVSLRDAIALTSDAITFAPALFVGGAPLKVLTLTRDALRIDRATTIIGPGADKLVIDASGNDPTPLVNNGDGSRVFTVRRLNSSSPPISVVITGLTLAGGDENTIGGAIYNIDNLTLDNVVIQGNAAAFGGGVFHTVIGQVSALILTNSRITGNTAGDDGGGLHCNSGYMSTTNCTISSNTAVNGAGIRNVANLAVVSTTISNNVSGNFGAGIHNDGKLDVFHSTISGNSSGFGGGIYNSGGGVATVVNTTISGNTARVDGGGIFNSGDLDVFFCTIAINHSDFDASGSGTGSGIYTAHGTTSTLVSNTLLFSNRDDQHLNGKFVEGASSYNILAAVGLGTGGLVDGVNGNRLGNFFGLVGLADNGGPTLTHALQLGFLAIDAGVPTAVPGVDGVPLYDQRGALFTRVHNGRIDIGAFEFQTPPTLPPSADFDADGDRDGADFLAWQRGFGSTGAAATIAKGNADGDGDVDAADFLAWRRGFGEPAASGAAIVETATAASASMAARDAIYAGGDFTSLFATSETSSFSKSRMRRR